MLFLLSPSRCDVFIFMTSAPLDKGVESISEFVIPMVQILLPPIDRVIIGWLAEEMNNCKWAFIGGIAVFCVPKV